MKRYYSLLLLFIVSITASAQFTHSRVVKHSEVLKQADIIIRHVNVVNMIDTVPLTNQIVVVTNNHISYIGADDEKKNINTHAQIIDGKGKFLMPGLAEMHAHLPNANNIKQYFTLNLMAGVTTIRSMRGDETHLAYRDIKDYPVPNLYLSAPVVTSKMQLTTQRADSLVKAYYNSKYDFIKVMSIKDTASFDNLMQAANKYGLKVCGHKPSNISLQYVLNSGFVSIAHLGGYDANNKNGTEHLNKMLQLTKDKNVYQDITLDWFRVVTHQISTDDMLQRAGMQYIHDTVKQAWTDNRNARVAKASDSAYKAFIARTAKMVDAKVDVVKQMAAKDIGLLIGSEGGADYMVPGYNMVEEMKAMQMAGLSNYQLLQYATVNAAKCLQQDNKWGTLEKGKQASMILLPTNPLTNLDALNKVGLVILNNKVHTKKALALQL